MSRKATNTRRGVHVLLNYKRQQKEENRTAVIDALLMLGTAKTIEIRDYLIKELWLRDNDKIRKRAQQRTELNKIKVPQNEYIKQISRSITLRTIQRQIRELKNEGMVGLNEKDGRYRLTEYARANLKLFGTQFGGSALTAIMNTHYPGLHSLEFNIEELIKIFGLYVLYCFTEGARPIEHSSFRDNVKRRGRYSLNKAIVDNLAKDRLALNWIKDVISPRDMFNYFLAAVKYYEENKGYDMRNMVKQPIDNQGERTFTVSIRNSYGNLERPKSASTLMEQRFFLLTSKDYIAKAKDKPLYELSPDTIKQITRILKQKYGIYYERLHEERALFLGKPKELLSSSLVKSAQADQHEKKSHILTYEREKDEI